jgi:hypothetical protein
MTQGEKGVGDTTTQETPLEDTPKETRPPKRPIIHTRVPRKKEKAHKQILEYTITEDDTDIFKERVEDCAVEEFEEVEQQRGKI